MYLLSSVVAVLFCLQNANISAGSTCPSVLQQSHFVMLQNKKSNCSDKLFIGNINVRYKCEIECVKRLDCLSYDHSDQEKKCELNFCNEQVFDMDAWIHGQKNLLLVSKVIIFILHKNILFQYLEYKVVEGYYFIECFLGEFRLYDLVANLHFFYCQL